MWSKQDLESPSLELIKRHKGERGLSQRFSKKMMRAWSCGLSTSLAAWKMEENEVMHRGDRADTLEKTARPDDVTST